MRKILYLILLLPAAILGQEGSSSNPNVELPDFVITGSEDVSIQNSTKAAPDFITTVSEDFFKPEYSPEELELKDVSSPIKNEVQLFDTARFYRGRLRAGAGIYTLPFADFAYAVPFTGGFFEATASGINKRPHVENSGIYSLGGGAGIQYFVNRNAPFLPGIKLKAEGDVRSTSYKYYAAMQPHLKRTFNTVNGEASAHYLHEDMFKFDLRIFDNFRSMQEITFSENVLGFEGYSKINLQNFSVGIKLKSLGETLKQDSAGSSSTGFLFARPFIGLSVGENLRAEFGMSYTSAGGLNDFTPYGSIALKLDKSISLFAEYSPHADFYTAGDFLVLNRYLNEQRLNSLYIRKDGMLRGAIKYEYDKYFQINGGFKYTSSPVYPYFSDEAQQGIFDVKLTDARSFEAFGDLLFHRGPFGRLYGRAEFNFTKDTSSSFVPYHPNSKLSLTYGYLFKIGLDAEASIIYNSGSYTNIANTQKIDQFIDLRMKFAYPISDTFVWTLELNNLLNQENYIYRGYKETPMDIVGGLSIRW